MGAKGKARRKAAPAKQRVADRILTSIRRRGRVISVGGPFSKLTLIVLPTELAVEVFPKGLKGSAGKSVVEGIAHDLAEIRGRDPEVAASGLAATAARLAYELESPFNSATSKSHCARSLVDVMERLRESLPPKEEKDKLDELSDRRRARRQRPAGT